MVRRKMVWVKSVKFSDIPKSKFADHRTSLFLSAVALAKLEICYRPKSS